MNYDQRPNWLSKFGLIVLTVNSVLAVYRSIGDKGSISFILFSYIDLLLLFWCLHLSEHTSATNATDRDRIKAAVWFLATILTVMFSWKVAAIMPPHVAVFVWLLASGTSVGGFYAIFLHKEEGIMKN
ncbi:hypothetical protein LUZ61_012758 [Rhynchospora tenuis]|uniref:Uncharacterized protein n=1 Tax=Rhynchospora tenuis TaxID=198213 RepID=A0AAD6A3N0_9POAL|nr:hypothetical protein LUZ61_012758 [Rhynchospora tenuis]